MEANYIILSFILIPLVGFLLSLVLPNNKESALAKIAFGTIALHVISVVTFFSYWLYKGASPLNVKEIVLYQSDSYEFFIDFYLDKISFTFLLIGSFITLLITKYSSYYLHLEEGYKRYFNTVLFFFLGYNLTVLSGNFETLFSGWEILGLSSFLLIGFYRSRYLPVKNALKVFSIYRIGDLGILLATWASHHLWHQNITFLELNNFDLVEQTQQSHYWVALFISMCLLLSASSKSAQFPFSFWLPKAMEGPTPSSAIFYGSLSVHLGVFLLLRTYPFWEHQILARWIVGVFGAITAVIAFFIARVQTNIKSQIAYASIAQIGLMIIEVALGLHTIVLIHFAGNAFLRTYQLLVSPSAVAYMMRDQLYNLKPQEQTKFVGWMKRLDFTLYVLSVQEWNMESIINKFFFRPVKMLGRQFNFLTQKNVLFFFAGLFIVGLILFQNEDDIPTLLHEMLPYIFSFIGLMMVFRSFGEKHSPILSWVLIIMSHLWIALAVSFNEHFDLVETIWFLGGLLLAGIFGLMPLFYLKRREVLHFNLDDYHGHAYEYPKVAAAYLLAALGLMGFPITMSFIGQDLIFSHISDHQFFMAFFYAMAYLFVGIALIRMYARLFLGVHFKKYHSTPLKSA